MPIAYLCLIILAFISSRIHWPLTNIMVVLGTVLMAIDILIQVIRTLIGKTHFSTLIGAFALALLSVGYAFIWLSWPGAVFTAWFVLVVSLGYFFYWYFAKRKINIRYGITAFVYVALLAFVLMKPSERLCFKNNIDVDNPVAPVFIRHHLAWYLNLEGDKAGAKRILQGELLEAVQKSRSEDEHYREVFLEDAAIIQSALNDLNNGSWTDYVPLIPESI